MSNVLDIARGEVGVTEWPPKSNHVKYWSDLAPDLQGSAWCAAFVAWCWQRAGIDLVRELRYGAYHCYTIKAWAERIGAWRTDTPSRATWWSTTLARGTSVSRGPTQ